MNNTKHKIITYSDKVEVWLHEDHASYSNSENDYLESDDNWFIARLTLNRVDLERLDTSMRFARETADQASAGSNGLRMSSIRFCMPGHMVSAAHLDDPVNVPKDHMAELFNFDPMFTKLEVFDSGDAWIRLYTDYDDSFVEIEITGIMDELRELKDKLE